MIGISAGLDDLSSIHVVNHLNEAAISIPINAQTLNELESFIHLYRAWERGSGSSTTAPDKPSDLVGLDIETTGLSIHSMIEILLIQLGTADQVFVFDVKAQIGDSAVKDLEATSLAAPRGSQARVRTSSFEWTFLEANGSAPAWSPCIDTMLAGKLAQPWNEGQQQSWGFWSQRHLGHRDGGEGRLFKNLFHRTRRPILSQEQLALRSSRRFHLLPSIRGAPAETSRKKSCGMYGDLESWSGVHYRPLLR